MEYTLKAENFIGIKRFYLANGKLAKFNEKQTEFADIDSIILSIRSQGTLLNSVYLFIM